MKKRFRTKGTRILALTLTALVVMGTAAPTSALPLFLFYKFTSVADTNGGLFQSVGLFPAMSNNGRVAFRGTLANGFEGMFTRLGTTGLNTLADTGLGEFISFGEVASINSNGVVLFVSQFKAEPKHEVILRGSGNASTPVIDSSGSFRGFRGFQINDVGTAAFAARRSNGNDVILIRGTSGSAAVVVEVGSLFMSIDRAPSINAAGTVAFTGTTTGGTRGIFVRNGSSGNFFTVIDDGSPWVGFAAVDINDSGTVAFAGTRDTTNRGIYRVNGGSTTTIVEGGQGSQEFVGFSLNNGGRVAYQRTNSFSSAVFLGPDVFKKRVVGTGDVLFGRTVVGTLIERDALNDQGSFAVHVGFADGSHMIVRVDPVVPPFADFINATAVLQLSTGSGSGIGATMPLPNPGSRSELSFDVRFLNDIGKLEVRLDDKVVKAIPAADVGVEKTIRVPLDFGAHYRDRKGAFMTELTLALDGKPGFSAQIDNVSIPGLLRASMDEEDELAGWKIDAAKGGSASIVDTTRFPVKIDVQPDKSPNVVKRGAPVSVAILSSAGLNAPEEIDRATIRLSGAPPRTTRDKKGGEQPACDAKDVNKDKLADLICEMQSDRIATNEGEATLVLEATTTSAMPIRGTDDAKVEGKGKTREAEPEAAAQQ